MYLPSVWSNKNILLKTFTLKATLKYSEMSFANCSLCLFCEVLDENNQNITICVPEFSQGLHRDENLVTGLGTTILFGCILYSW